MAKSMAKRWLKQLAGLCLAAAALAPAALGQASLSSAVKKDAWSVQGLGQPAEIVIDHWGIAHIFAGSERDAFFLQGYNAARDRLWEIDLWRKRGLGRLSASFGPAYVEQDRAARLFLYRGDMAKEWAAYSPDARQIVEAWVEGVNAYVAEVRAGAKPLPVEFNLTKSAPEDWKAEDVLRIRSHALVSNITSEVARAHVVCAGGVEADQLRRKLEPEGHKLVIPKGLDPCDVPSDVLKTYLLATKQVEFEAFAGRAEKAELSGETELAQAIEAQSNEGSNNWIIAPSRTATGRPILANDPHRQLGAPSLRYVVGLNAPGLNLIGAGEPALPGVSLGHNDDIAFGITIFAIDQEDLYVYQLKPGDPDSYRYKNGWRKMEVVHDSIEVKGMRPRQVELRYTQHGPVLEADADKGRAFAMRTVWQEPGLSGYFGSSRLWRAKTWDEFKAASNAWGAPPLNLVYADVRGNTGWAASGRTPVRRNWDGLMPVPGDGRYEWDGYFKDNILPSIANPPQGYLGTANEFNLPAGYPAEDRKIAFEWTDPSRANRIKEVLAANSKSTIADSMALQTDTVSTQSRRLIALLPEKISTLACFDNFCEDRVAKAVDLLRRWDNNETTSSAAAAIYEVWANKHLGRLLVSRVTPAPARQLVAGGSLEAVISYLEHADAASLQSTNFQSKSNGSDPEFSKGAPDFKSILLLKSLSDALDELTKALGEDMSTWTWGRLHHATWAPAIAVLADPQLRAQMTVGPLELPGSASSPRAQTYSQSSFNVTAGASVRMVMDVGAWDNSVVINTPGQSGDPFSAHYRDLFPLWAEGQYVPLSFSRAAVDANAERVISLSPSAQSKGVSAR